MTKHIQAIGVNTGQTITVYRLFIVQCLFRLTGDHNMCSVSMLVQHSFSIGDCLNMRCDSSSNDGLFYFEEPQTQSQGKCRPYLVQDKGEEHSIDL